MTLGLYTHLVVKPGTEAAIRFHGGPQPEAGWLEKGQPQCSCEPVASPYAGEPGFLDCELALLAGSVLLLVRTRSHLEECQRKEKFPA